MHFGAGTANLRGFDRWNVCAVNASWCPGCTWTWCDDCLSISTNRRGIAANLPTGQSWTEGDLQCRFCYVFRRQGKCSACECRLWGDGQLPYGSRHRRTQRRVHFCTGTTNRRRCGQWHSAAIDASWFSRCAWAWSHDRVHISATQRLFVVNFAISQRRTTSYILR